MDTGTPSRSTINLLRSFFCGIKITFNNNNEICNMYVRVVRFILFHHPQWWLPFFSKVFNVLSLDFRKKKYFLTSKTTQFRLILDHKFTISNLIINFWKFNEKMLSNPAKKKICEPSFLMSLHKKKRITLICIVKKKLCASQQLVELH